MEKKKYLQNLKSKCFVGAVKSIKPTNFDSLSINDIKLDKNKNLVGKIETKVKFEVQNELLEASANSESYSATDTNFLYDVSENMYETGADFLSQEIDRPYFVPMHRSVRPLQSYNGSGSQDTLIACSVMPDMDMQFHKPKMFIKDYSKNKENIKLRNCFPNAKYPEHMERYKKSVICQPLKKGPKGIPNNEFIKNKYKATNKLISDFPNCGKEMHIIPKNDPHNSQQDISSKDPQDMMEPKKSESTKTDSGSSKSSSPSVSKSSNVSSMVHAETSSSSSSSGHSNKPYLRQLFEQDIQSNFALTSKVKKTEKPDNVESANLKDEKEKCKKVMDEKNVDITEKSQEQDIPAAVIGQVFLSSLVEQAKTTIPESSLSAAVIGQSFLKTLAEQTPLAKDKPIPADVIGQSFIKNLLDYKSIEEKIANESEKIIESVAMKKDSCGAETKKDILPSYVLSQAFLRSLIENQNNTLEESTADSTLALLVQTAVPTAEMSPVPTPITHQTSDAQTTSIAEKTIPSSAIGQTFLKSLFEESQYQEKINSKSIPSAVVGQTFLKTLMEQTPDSQDNPEKVTLPSSVVGQIFLKTLLEEIPEVKGDSKKSILPSAVVGQAFLKTLVDETSKDDETVRNPVIPSSVLGQTFLKTVIEQAPKTEEATKECVIPSTAISQAFLKSLVEVPPKSGDSLEEPIIPSSVIGHSFLKTLTEQVPNILKTSIEPAIPSSVIGQTFLQTLLDQTLGVKEATKEPVVPSSVVEQAFLKTLVEQTPKSQESVIPSSVVGQAFLKTLIEHTPQILEIPQEPVIPSSVVGQTFLKTLIDQTSETKETKEPVLPSAVVGQTFLKTLIEKVPQEKDIIKEPVIPSSVVGQAFLKTLIDQTSDVQESSSAGGQTCLKTLLDQTSVIKEDIKETIIPSSVVGQAFLKTLMDESPQCQVAHTKSVDSVTIESTKDNIIPSAVVEQTFLKTLIEQTSNTEFSKNPTIPSSVVGSTFLKSLSDEINVINEISGTRKSNAQEEQSDKKSIPASVIGQAFLKTLHNISNQEISASEKKVATTSSFEQTVQFCGKELGKPENIDTQSCSNGCVANKLSELSLLDEQTAIIPPPPEFCTEPESTELTSVSPSSEMPGSSKNELSTSIIEELLTCTKVMESVIENLKETEHQQSHTGVHLDVTDICTKDKS